MSPSVHKTHPTYIYTMLANVSLAEAGLERATKDMNIAGSGSWGHSKVSTISFKKKVLYGYVYMNGS